MQQTHGSPVLPHGDLVSPNRFGFGRNEVRNLGRHVTRLYGFSLSSCPETDKEAGTVGGVIHASATVA